MKIIHRDSFTPVPGWNLLLFTLCGGIANAVLMLVNEQFSSPLFFDSLGTAYVGLLTGPLGGILTAVWTHLLAEALHGMSLLYFPWVFCSIATGLITGFAGLSLRSGRRYSSPFFLTGLILSVTIANSVVGAVTGAILYQGATTHSSDYLVSSLITVGRDLFSASFLARIPLNLVDKAIAVGITFPLARYHIRMLDHMTAAGNSSNTGEYQENILS